MYSITSQISLKVLEERHLPKAKVIFKDGFHAVVVGNKSDLDSQREVSFQEGKNVAENYGIPFLEISLKNDDKIAYSIF